MAYPHILWKTELKMDYYDLSVREKTTKLLEYNIVENLYDFVLVDKFLGMISKA